MIKLSKRSYFTYLIGLSVLTLLTFTNLFTIPLAKVSAENVAFATPVLQLDKLSQDPKAYFPLATFDPSTNTMEDHEYRWGVMRAEIDKNLAGGQPPEISKLNVSLKSKNKAVANFEVMDADGNLGKKSGISVLLYDRNLDAVVAPRAGNLLLFNDKDIFSPPLDFTGKTTATFPFSLKGLKQFPQATIWASSIRDDAGRLSIAPAVVGIGGRVSGGKAPEIMNSNAAIFQNDDAVGVNIDGMDMDGDTIGMTLSFLDVDMDVVLAISIVGNNGLENFGPFPLELVRNPVRGKKIFNINFSVAGVSKEVKPGTIRAVGISLVDSSGNRSESRIVAFGS